MKKNTTGKNVFFLLLFLLSINFSMLGQMDPQYSQYMYTTTYFNPAYAGSDNCTNITGSYRSQWVGLDGAPKTASISMNAPMYKKMGVGVSLINDNIGPMQENNLALDLSYGLDIDNFKLAFGIKTSLNVLNVDFTKLKIYNDLDPVFASNVENQLSPNVGAGVYAYSSRFYVGLSVPQMIMTKRYNEENYSVVHRKFQTYLIGGYVFDLDYNLKFKPTFMIKNIEGAPLQADVSANFLYAEKFNAGISYRVGSSFSALCGFQITNNLFIGYSYDTEVTKLTNYNSGSHELFVGFKIFKSGSSKNLEPRFF
ncbi:type IX secretion system membrane protein PorP/SprF [Flavobacterium sp. FlaQc-50]|uniref:PorP/SprF family type IX secretion system membrane protein n=1 Tax=unclassified Flavobacterium TaxID=196869 RepID=UPI0037564C81